MLLLLLGACSDYKINGQDPGLRDSSLIDSAECAACSLAAGPASTVVPDASCNHPDVTVADPLEIEVGTELFVDLTLTERRGGTVAVVADLDADGLPEIAVIDDSDSGMAVLSVFDADGAVKWQIEGVARWWSLAAVDLDGADGAELLLDSCLDFPWCSDERLTLRAPEGDILWASPEDTPTSDPHVAPLICDLHGDGVPEVIAHGMVLDGATGAQIGRYVLPTAPDTPASCADIDHDGALEFAAAGRLFNSEGDLLWSIAPHAGDLGASFAIQADADLEPEFLFVSPAGTPGFTVADTDGTVLSEVSRGIQNSDSIAVTDLDGNGTTEIVMATKEWSFAAYELDGTLLWDRADLGYITWVSAWDLDGDGASELLVEEQSGVDGGQDAFKILAGTTGDVLYSTPNVSYGGWPPLVADLDNDGHAEIVVAGGAPREGLLPSATIYRQVDNTWPAAGPAWPVPDYHLTNVGPAGEIPRGEPDPPSWMYNVVHARPAVDGQGVNLTPTVAQVCTDTCDDTVQIDVVVTNSGPMPANDVVVRVYAGSTMLTDVAVGRVGSGAVSEGTIVTLAASDFDRGEIRLVVDPDDGSPECDEGDNELVMGDPR